MENRNRIQCVLLGLLCLMPALFFWVIKSLPVEVKMVPISLGFRGASNLEFVVCGFVFPVLAIMLGWNAFHRCESKAFSLLVIGIGVVEIAAAIAAAIINL